VVWVILARQLKFDKDMETRLEHAEDYFTQRPEKWTRKSRERSVEWYRFARRLRCDCAADSRRTDREQRRRRAAGAERGRG